MRAILVEKPNSYALVGVPRLTIVSYQNGYIPEPATLALSLVGLACSGVMALRRRRK